MKSTICIVLIFSLLVNLCNGQILDGYMISISRSPSQIDDGILDLESGSTVFVDSIKHILGNRYFKTYTSFIAGISRINDGKIVASQFTQRKTCSSEAINIPKKIPFKTLTVDFENKEKPAFLYIYKVQFSYCSLKKSDLKQLRGFLYSDSLDFIAVKEFLKFKKVDKYFCKQLRSQINKFGFGIDYFFDDGSIQ